MLMRNLKKIVSRLGAGSHLVLVFPCVLRLCFCEGKQYSKNLKASKNADSFSVYLVSRILLCILQESTLISHFRKKKVKDCGLLIFFRLNLEIAI